MNGIRVEDRLEDDLDFAGWKLQMKLILKGEQVKAIY